MKKIPLTIGALEGFCRSYHNRECVKTGAAGARTPRSLGHHLLHPLISRLLILCAPADFESQSIIFFVMECLLDSRVIFRFFF